MNHNLVKALLAALAVSALVAALAAEKTTVPDELAEKDAQAATYRAGADWEAFLGSGGDSKSTETGILRDWPATGLRIAWAIETGEGYSAPAISRGRLFHFDRVGDQARLTCLESETGKELWQETYFTDYSDYYDYSNGPRTSPVVDGDRVYSLGVEGRLRCHRVTDGELLWDVDIVAQFGVVQNFFGVGGNPVVHDDLLIAMIGGSPAGSPKIHSGEVQGNGSGIVAFDKHTGEEVYRFSDELASYATPRLAVIHGRPWGFAFTRGGLLGFEPASGRQDFYFPWKAKLLESVNASTPVIVDDTVFISETYGPGSALLRVSPGAYEVVWQDPPGRGQALETHWNTPVFHQGYLYASSGRNTAGAELRCVRHATGEVLWRRDELGRATLLYVEGHFVVLSENGELRLIKASPQSYQEVAFVDLAALEVDVTMMDGSSSKRPLIKMPAWNAPVLSHGLLYLRGKDTLAALELIPST
ncbi:MAG: PQQ-binding-like beta-propeller repeat protein [Acidobacteria bacterium]|nr:PQQ-binding-like beta-propeller repeat protein [Acidobacteriota bacterium]